MIETKRPFAFPLHRLEPERQAVGLFREAHLCRLVEADHQRVALLHEEREVVGPQPFEEAMATPDLGQPGEPVGLAKARSAPKGTVGPGLRYLMSSGSALGSVPRSGPVVSGDCGKAPAQSIWLFKGHCNADP